MYYDVVVAGGSVAGLLCAREVASEGFSVIVLEEDHEIGTPEHCGGLVSLAGLEELGVVPFGGTLDLVESAVIEAPDGSSFRIDAKRQRVAEVSRRELDKQIAFQAQRSGAKIMTRARFQELTGDGIRTDREEIGCRIFVDARGVSSLVHRDRSGILQSAQYEVYADWIQKGTVRVIFDQQRYPGFFAWVIPSGYGRGKVGVAGRGINAAQAIEELLAKMGSHSVIRKIYAPIWIKGPIKSFVEGRTVIVGDAAGQAKPTTAGGIFTSGMGGVYAGRHIARFLKTGNGGDLRKYQSAWSKRFGKEFERQLIARKALERLDNDSIGKLFGTVTPAIAEASQADDFDFHTSAIIRMLGLRRTVGAVQVLAKGELQRLFSKS